MAELAALLFDHAPTAMLYFDRDLYLRQMNRQAEKLWGCPAHTLLGKPCAELNLAGVEEAALHEVTLNAAPIRLSATATLLDELAAHLQISYTPIPEHGAAGVLVSASDVTPERILEQELRASHEELQAIIDNLPASVIVIEPSGQVALRNRANLELSGLADTVPARRRDTQIELRDSYYPDGTRVALEEYPRYRAAAGEEISGQEMYFYDSNGAQRWLSVNASPIRDERGEVRLAVSVAWDITRQHKLERELRQGRDELQAVLDNMTEAVSLVEADGTVRYINRSGRILLGLSEADSYGNIADYAGLDLRDSAGNLIPFERNATVRALRGEVFTDAEQVLVGPNGVSRIINLSGTSVRGEDGQVRLAITVAREVTSSRALEQELQDKNEELRAVLDNMTDGVWLTTPDGKAIYRNPASDRILGVSSADAISDAEVAERVNIRHLDGSAMAPTDYPLYRAMRGEVFANEEVRFLGLDGQERLISMSGSCLRDAAGQVRLAISVARDITSERELEAELRRRGSELQAVLDNMTEGVLIVEADGRVRYRNEAELRIMGLTKSKQPPTAIPDTSLSMRYLDATPVPADELPVGRVLRGERFTLTEYLITNLVGEDLLVSTDGTPVRDEQGRITAAVVVNRDLTRQYETEQEVRRLLGEAEREHQRLLSVIEQMPDGVIVTAAPDNRLVVMNRVAAEIYGLDAELLPRSEDRYLTNYETLTQKGEAVALEARPLARALEGEAVKAVQMKVRRLDGKEIDLLVSAAPIVEGSAGNARITGAVSVFQDISELRELDRLKDEFISITSHELRTPLTSIKGYAEMLSRRLRRMDEGVRTELQKPVDIIIERAERMSQMTNDLLDVSRIATARLEVEGQLMDLTRVVRKLVEETRPTYHRQILLDASAEPTPVLGEERLLEQVLGNLIGNAVKYSPDDTPITVKVVKARDSVQVSVIDQGIGIAKEHQRRLFERFYRSEQGKQAAQGLGLGLYISAGIVQAHGGHIWAESAGEGSGSTFSFSLPLALLPPTPLSPQL